MHEHSLAAQRIICDHLRAVGGVLNVPITKKLLAAAASSREKYEKHLQNQRDKKKDSFKAEATGQLTFVTKSNALRKAAKEKTLQLQEVEDKLNGKLEALKGC